MARTTSSLVMISPDEIRPNPDNPRLIFREDDMRKLLDSIREVGIKVPVSLFSDNDHYILIDGERRWRCAKRLNLDSMPAIVQPKPSKLENLLMMFNIHNVRVDWDPMPMALKLKEVKDLLQQGGKPTNAKELSVVTGLSLATVRRALDLLSLPQKYQELLIKESEKPRSEQKFKADLFIEIYKSLHVIERHASEVLSDVTRTEYVDSMVEKYRNGVVDNVVAYREVSRMARSDRAGVEKKDVVPTLVKLVKDKTYSIKDAYGDTVQDAYQKRDLLTTIVGLTDKLRSIKSGAHIGDDLRNALRDLAEEVNRLLRK